MRIVISCSPKCFGAHLATVELWTSDCKIVENKLIILKVSVTQWLKKYSDLNVVEEKYEVA